MNKEIPIFCSVCDAVEYVGGEIDERTLEDQGWYIVAADNAYCPEHNNENQS